MPISHSRFIRPWNVLQLFYLLVEKCTYSIVAPRYSFCWMEKNIVGCIWISIDDPDESVEKRVFRFVDEKASKSVVEKISSSPVFIGVNSFRKNKRQKVDVIFSNIRQTAKKVAVDLNAANWRISRVVYGNVISNGKYHFGVFTCCVHSLKDET